MPKATTPIGAAITIRSVAQYAGVSPMSVSNVLNGRQVTPRIREAVERSIAALDYVPNPAARQLSRGSTLSIGVLYGAGEHPLTSAMLIGASTAAERLGATLMPQSTPWEDIAAAWDAVRSLVAKGAKAILLPPNLAAAMDLCFDPDAADLPIMTVATGEPLSHIGAVRIDDIAAAAEMTALLIGKGHRRIGFIRSEHFPSVRESRFAGYTQALAAAGIAFDPALVRDASLTFEGGLTAAGSLLDMPAPPSAIFASNDDMGAGALVAAHTRRLAIPDQVAIAGFDDSFLASRVWPALSSVRIPLADMAERAVETLIGQIRGRGRARADGVPAIFVDYQVMKRGSTGD